MNNKKLVEVLQNPEIFNINRLDATSDHVVTDRKGSLESFRHSLNGEWKFNYIYGLENRKEDFYKSVDIKDLDTISVPSHIEFNGYGNFQYVNTQYPWDGIEDLFPPQIPTITNQIGQYFKTFDYPKSFDKDTDIFICFDGVEVAFSVYLNGEFIGYSEDSHTPSKFNLTEHMKEENNLLVVEVYKYSSASWLEDQDYWRHFGIHRDVYLYKESSNYIKDIFVKTELKNDYKDAVLSLELQANKSQDLEVVLIDKEGNEVITSKESIKESSVLTYEVKDVALWSSEAPNLYKLRIKTEDSQTELNVGFREFKMENNIMKINGERIYFRGVNRHDVSPVNGRSVTKEEMKEDIIFFKENNFNAVRTSHYPNQKYIYDLCDEYGLYVIDEANLETHGTWMILGVPQHDSKKIVPHHKKEWLGACLDRAKSMLERDKNHPSIIIWSCGNESYAGEVISSMANFYRDRDDSRLVHYEGCFHYRDFDDASDMESRMYARVSDIKEYLDNDPKKPFINCEYSHAMGNSNGGLIDYDLLDDEYEMYQGGFIWEYMDHGIYDEEGRIRFGGDFGDRPTDYNFVIDGLRKADKSMTPKIPEIKQVFSPIKINVEKDKYTVTNKNLFIDLTDYSFKREIYYNGDLLDYFIDEVNVSPKSSKTISFNYDFSNEGEYVVRVICTLNKDVTPLKQGHRVTFGETNFIAGTAAFTVDNKHQTIRVVDGDLNLGIHGETFSVIFSKQFGKMSSLKYEGVEFLPHPYNVPSPNFYRATTDNDIGAGMSFKLQKLKTISYNTHQFGKILSVSVEEERVSISTRVFVPYEHIEIYVDYVVHNNGKIDVTQILKNTSELENLYRFGMSFKVPKEYDLIKWYGNGPYETYLDRLSSGMVGKYEVHIDDQLTYERPQSYGNKTMLRHFNVVNSDCKGLRFTSNKLFEASAVRHNEHELDLAYHQEELPNITHTNINIDMQNTGIAGDDSWMSWALDKYTLKADKDLSFTFSIEYINKKQQL